jgi:hypothetical protein
LTGGFSSPRHNSVASHSGTRQSSIHIGDPAVAFAFLERYAGK